MSNDEVVDIEDSDSDESVVITDEIPPKAKTDTIWASVSFRQCTPIPKCIVLDDDDEDEKDGSYSHNNNRSTKKSVEMDLLQPLFAIDEPSPHKEKHVKVEQNKSEFPCDMCEKIFYNKNLLAEHVMEHYIVKTKKRLKLLSENSQFRCSVCLKSFGNLNAYEWHAAECSGKFLAEENLNIRLTRNKK